MAKASRKTFDQVLIFLGIVITIVLLAFGALALYGSHFAKTEVTNQLSAQRIYFPPAGSPAISALPAADQAEMNRYAGQLMSNGLQAKVYADNFIAVHLSEVAGGKTYAEVSTAALANPTDQKLATQKAVLFQGETLRGLLLTGYAYWTFGTIAAYAAIASFAGAALMFLLVIMGLAHLSRLK